MKERWPVPTIVSLSLSSLAVAGVILLALVSCVTPPTGVDQGPAPVSGEPSQALENLRDLQSSFNFISETVSPSVVRIDVRERVTQNGPQLGLPFFDYFFGRPDDEEPQDRGFDRGGVGSGVIVASDRQRYFVLTNDHVVGSADSITVVLSDGTELDAELVGRDARKDLAMVSIRTDRDLQVARLGDSDELRAGDWVVAIGSPFGYQNTITAGIVSAIDRRGGPDGNISDFIQTDASINQGNSGGALVNLDGEVVGINTWITSDSGGSIGLGFAIPVNNVIRSISEFLEDGEVEYGWLGVSIQTVDADQAESLRLPSRSGALVDSVFARSPAAVSGILPGDFILRIGETSITNSNELVLLVGELQVGQTVEFLLIRDGAQMSIPVTIAARQTEAAIGQQSRLRWPGFSVYPLTDEIIDEAGLEVSGGAIVSAVDQGSPADIGGLQAFDVLTAINGAALSDLLSFYRIIANPDLKEWRFAGVRNGEEFRSNGGAIVAKEFLSQKTVRDNALKLARRIHCDGFIPDVIYVSLRGGAYVGNVISEYFKLIRRGQRPVFYAAVVARSYTDIHTRERVMVDGWTYSPEYLRSGDRILLIDDIFDSGRTINHLVEIFLEKGIPRSDIKVAVHDYKIRSFVPERLPIEPDYWCRKHVVETPEQDTWIHYLSHELVGLTDAEIREHYSDDPDVRAAIAEVSQTRPGN